MADARFDRARFESRLSTRRLGRALLTRAETSSTNDDVWDALAQGLPDGVTVIADAQSRGRGRLGRVWAHAPGLGLAMSVGLHLGCDRRPQGATALVAGLAVAEGLASLGVRVALKWPNDVMLRGRKLAGVLCESRALPRGDAVVIGIGLNVAHGDDDFPDELRLTAISLHQAGHEVAGEDLAAAILGALETRWDALQEGDRAEALAAWSAHTDMFGRAVTVRGAQGVIEGVARGLDPDGGLIVRLESGVETVVVAGEVEALPADGSRAS